eukprot:3735194-Prymnesium_polylepis.1
MRSSEALYTSSKSGAAARPSSAQSLLVKRTRSYVMGGARIHADRKASVGASTARYAGLLT